MFILLFSTQHHTLERTFSDDDAADLALLMMERSVSAAANKVQLYQEQAGQAETEVKTTLEKYAAKALAETIERERQAGEKHFLSTEHFDDEFDVTERQRDMSIMHADNKLLPDAFEEEHDAELKLERAIEKDIAAKQELEQMIDNKAALKGELHELEKIIHEHAVMVWEKEKARKSREH